MLDVIGRNEMTEIEWFMNLTSQGKFNVIIGSIWFILMIITIFFVIVSDKPKDKVKEELDRQCGRNS